MQTLGASVSAMYRELTEALLREREAEPRSVLQTLHRRLGRSVGELVDAQVRPDTPTYVEACGALKDACKALKSGRAELGRHAQVLEATAKAVRLVERVARGSV